MRFLFPSLRFVSCAILLFGLTGCMTYGNADQTQFVQDSQVIGTRFVVISDRDFPLTKAHYLPQWIEGPGPTVFTQRGNILLVVHVEKTTNTWHAFVVYAVQAEIENGEHKGQRVQIGTIGNLFGESDRSLFHEEYRAISIMPVPAVCPPWLDCTAVPPQIRNASTANLISALDDQDWIVRYYATAGLVLRFDSTSLAAVQRAARDANPWVQETAKEAMRIQATTQPSINAVRQANSEWMNRVLIANGS